MTDYEMLLLLDPELAEERQTAIVGGVRTLVEKGGGTFDRHDPWGRRKLAYPIEKKEDGIYHLLTFSADAGDARRGLARAQDRRRRAASPGDTSPRDRAGRDNGAGPGDRRRCRSRPADAPEEE